MSFWLTILTAFPLHSIGTIKIYAHVGQFFDLVYKLYNLRGLENFGRTGRIRQFKAELCERIRQFKASFFFLVLLIFV